MALNFCEIEHPCCMAYLTACQEPTTPLGSSPRATKRLFLKLKIRTHRSEWNIIVVVRIAYRIVSGKCCICTNLVRIDLTLYMYDFSALRIDDAIAIMPVLCNNNYFCNRFLSYSLPETSSRGVRAGV